MHALELKIPPPVVALLCALIMWALARYTPALAAPALVRGALAAALALAGLGIAVVGVMSFRRARTTIHPLRPADSSALVTGGIYRRTRNPMYVGMLLVLIAWAVWLGSPAALIGAALFAAFITRFQIVPEERVLAGKFGDAYAAYAQAVRRWF